MLRTTVSYSNQFTNGRYFVSLLCLDSEWVGLILGVLLFGTGHVFTLSVELGNIADTEQICAIRRLMYSAALLHDT